MERSIDPKRLQFVFTVLETMEGYHPSEPHWYLPLIGVEPARQGRGHGSALLSHALLLFLFLFGSWTVLP
jgi:ribosomal protein S18 acetylase RimI-like enzyme